MRKVIFNERMFVWTSCRWIPIYIKTRNTISFVAFFGVARLSLVVLQVCFIEKQMLFFYCRRAAIHTR